MNSFNNNFLFEKNAHFQLNKVFPLTKLIVILVCIFGFNCLQSQTNYTPGYIIDNQSNKISGFIKHSNGEKNPDEIYFKTEAGKETIYAPNDIKEFGLLDEIYVSAFAEIEVSPRNISNLSDNPLLNLERDTVFLQSLIQGEKSLYHYRTKQGIKNFYIKQGNQFKLLEYKKYKRVRGSREAILELKNYAAQLQEYFNQCPITQNKYSSLQYNQTSLEKLYYYYYKYCSSEKISFKKETPPLEVNVGLLGGFTRTQVLFEADLDSYDFLTNMAPYGSIDFSAGVYADIIFPKNRQKWSINNELLVSNFRVEGEYEEIINANHSQITQTDLEFRYFKFTTMLRHKYQTGNSKIFFNLGISNGFMTKKRNIKRRTVILYNENKVNEGLAVRGLKKYEVSSLLGVGYRINRYSIEVRYEIGNGFSRLNDLKTSTHQLYLLLGVNLF